MRHPVLLSVHTPKCGGSSVRSAFKAQFGDAMALDNGDRIADPASPYNLDPKRFWSGVEGYAQSVEDKAVVHGHFHPLKYQAVESAVYVTYMRDPLERALSHYFFWKSKANNTSHVLWSHVIDNDLTFEEFCQLPDINQLYTRHFFRGFDLDRFEIVGFADALESFAERMRQRFGVSLNLGRENVTTASDYAAAKSHYLEDAVMRERLTDHFRHDLAIYDWFRTKFD